MAKINNLADEINQALQIYNTLVNGEIKESAEEVTKEAAENLKKSNKYNDRTGLYRKSWDAMETDNGWVTYNRTLPQLTHLLEKGHANRDGGRTPKFVHIKPVERKAIKDFEKKIRERL